MNSLLFINAVNRNLITITDTGARHKESHTILLLPTECSYCDGDAWCCRSWTDGDAVSKYLHNSTVTLRSVWGAVSQRREVGIADQGRGLFDPHFTEIDVNR